MMWLPLWAGAQEKGGTTGAMPAGTIIVTGIVRDTAGNPLSGAEVYTLGGRRTFTNEKGIFFLDNIPAGSVDMIFRRIGYAPGSLGFDSEPGLKVSLAATLISNAHVLSTIVIEGRKVLWPLYKAGFYARQEKGRGVFLTPEQLEGDPATIRSILRKVPHIRVPGGSNAEAITSQNGCSLPVFIDGALIPWATGQGLDDAIKREDILAVEIFERGSDLPIRFRNDVVQASPSQPSTGDFEALMRFDRVSVRRCGAILIWSKSGSG